MYRKFESAKKPRMRWGSFCSRCSADTALVVADLIGWVTYNIMLTLAAMGGVDHLGGCLDCRRAMS
jgi:hypothetical protein